jgi:uncharacterized protein
LLQLSGFHLDLEEKLKASVDVIVNDSLIINLLELISREEILLYEHV